MGRGGEEGSGGAHLGHRLLGDQFLDTGDGNQCCLLIFGITAQYKRFNDLVPF